MAQQIEVLVRDKESNLESKITYKAYKDTAYKYQLLGQIDDSGNLIEGDPNLEPQHQRKSANPAAVASVETQTPPKLTPEQLEAKRQELLNRMPALQTIVEPEKVEKTPVVEPEVKEKRKYNKRQNNV